MDSLVSVGGDPKTVHASSAGASSMAETGGTPQKRKVVLPGCPVSSLSWPASAGAFLVPGRWFLRPCPFGFLFVFGSASCFFILAAGVTFQLPAGGTSGQAQGHRPKNRYRAPTQGPAFSGTFYVRLSCVPRVPDLFFPLHFAIYFPRMLWALQWLSSTPAAPYSVVQDKSSSPLRILSLSWRSTGCLGGRRSRWSLLSLSKGTEQRVFHWLSLSKHL